jgi:hypothetical protein
MLYCLSVIPLLLLFSAIAVVQSSISRGGNILGSSHHSRTEPRKLEIVNNSGKKLVVDWIDPISGKVTTLHNGVADGQTQVFNSFVNHTFSIHESTEGCRTSLDGQINNHDCAVRFITVTENAEQSKFLVCKNLYCCC